MLVTISQASIAICGHNIIELLWSHRCKVTCQSTYLYCHTDKVYMCMFMFMREHNLIANVIDLVVE